MHFNLFMLFHLKEPDYKIIDQPPTRFYGRTPEQILATLDYYLQRTQKDGIARNNPNLVWWAKRDFGRDDLEEVSKGQFTFFGGMIFFGDATDDEPLFEELKITDEFSVYVPKDNIGTFALWRTRIPQMKRGALYQLRNPIDLFMNTSLVPEDIAHAIMNHDLKPYIEAVKQDIARREQLSRHPSIKVDGLQRILEGQTEPLPRQN